MIFPHSISEDTVYYHPGCILYNSIEYYLIGLLHNWRSLVWCYPVLQLHTFLEVLFILCYYVSILLNCLYEVSSVNKNWEKKIMRIDFCIALHGKNNGCFYVIVLHEIILTASLLILPLYCFSYAKKPYAVLILKLMCKWYWKLDMKVLQERKSNLD